MSIPEYDSLDGLGLAQRIAAGDLSPSEVLEEAIARAERYNPRLNAIVIPMYDHARARVRDGLPAGPLRGVPFLLKDLISPYAGVPLRGASRLYRDNVPDHDAELVRRYKAAGLSIFGKTNTSEWGILPVTEPTIYGPTENPWLLGHTAGGSSGGAAAAVAARIVPFAHGGDGGGSIRIPAACCGVFGFKPTRGRVPVGPDASELLFGFAIEHVLTRSVRDSASMLDVCHGPEGTARFQPPPREGTFLGALERPLAPMRIAFTSEPLLPGTTEPHGREAVEEAARLCASMGHQVEEVHPPVDAHGFARDFFLSFCAAAAGELEFARAALGRRVRTSDVETSTWLLALIGRTMNAGEYTFARRRLDAAAREVLRFFDRYDALLTPTLGMLPPPHYALQARGLEARLQRAVARMRLTPVLKLPRLIEMAVNRAYNFTPNTSVFNVTGQPAMSVPLHWTAEGAPVGVQAVGRFGEDARLLQLAAALEQARPWADRRPPLVAAD
ncbi:MAG: amidase [Myxococcales bacterium]|nr:amidase [Myxococcales bacterium]